MTAPTAKELAEYLECLEAGIDPEVARTEVWSERPPTKPVMMLEEFGDGIAVGWVTCSQANGGCGEHVTKCTCKKGPHQPKVFQEWRDETKVAPTVLRPALAAARADSAPAETETDPAARGLQYN